jgi:serine O-acetyltransferase
MSVDWENPVVKKVLGIIQHYQESTYWKYRERIIKKSSGILLYWYLLRVKSMDAFNNASIVINIGYGAEFDGIPRFPHGLNGIIISPYAKFGKNVRIFQQVTVGDDGRNSHNVPTIEDYVFLYPGCKVLGKCTIGKGAKIGANCVVSFDVPPYAFVTAPKPTIHIKEHAEN